VTLSIEMDRDDLALALLRRDRKVAQEDRAALPLATRRGFTEVSLTLIGAGADVNAVDAQGATALALAERRRDAAVVKALIAAGAKPGAQAAPTVAGNDFRSVAAKEIDDVAFFDPPRFAMYPRGEAPFAFYGSGGGLNQFEQVKCERSAAFEFIAEANQVGGISVGVCTSEAKRVRELAVAAEPAMQALLAQLTQGGAKPDPAMLAKFGWTYSRSTGPSGAEEHYFALIAVGHGVLSAPTLVLVPRGGRQAVVVQAQTMNLCERGVGTQTPLCSNPRQALTDISRRLQAKFAP